MLRKKYTRRQEHLQSGLIDGRGIPPKNPPKFTQKNPPTPPIFRWNPPKIQGINLAILSLKNTKFGYFFNKKVGIFTCKFFEIIEKFFLNVFDHFFDVFLNISKLLKKFWIIPSENNFGPKTHPLWSSFVWILRHLTYWNIVFR